MNNAESEIFSQPIREQRSRVEARWLRWPVVALATATLFLGAIPSLRAKEDADKPTPPKLQVDSKPLVRDGNLPRSFAPIVQKVSSSVVQVYTSTRPRPLPGFNQEDPFNFFFGNPQPRRGQAAPRQQGAGSGVIVSSDGYLLTNNHVIEGADDVKVKLSDGREVPANVVGRDEKTDVAVLKITAEELSPATFADSDRLEVGDVVFAVGNPFGIGQTVTMGIISATSRATFGLPYEDFIQTDAAINPGNSGGALVDADGRLIGINTAIISRSGGNQGIGFAIPANIARDVLEALVTDGKVTRGYLGVLPQDVTPALARKLDLKDRGGAILSEVTPRSPAEKAGLESGDVVTEVNGKPIRDANHLRLEVARVKPGQSASLRVRRDGDTKLVKVTVRERPEEQELSRSNGDRESTDPGTLNGVGVADLNAQNRRQYRIPERIKGVIVTEVEEGSPSWEAGLRAGNVILELNKKVVESAEEAVALTEKPKDKTTLLKVYTPATANGAGGGTRFLVVDESSSK
jgi:serine protease Do